MVDSVHHIRGLPKAWKIWWYDKGWDWQFILINENSNTDYLW